MADHYQPATSDLNVVPNHFNEGDRLYSEGAGDPVNGPFMRIGHLTMIPVPAPWVLYYTIFQQTQDKVDFPDGFPGWQFFESKEGLWRRNFTRAIGGYDHKFGIWSRILEYPT